VRGHSLRSRERVRRGAAPGSGQPAWPVMDLTAREWWYRRQAQAWQWQSAHYLDKQLQDFASGARDKTPFMSAIAKGLNAQTRFQLTA